MSAGVIIANQQGLCVSIDSAATLKNKIIFENATKVYLLNKDKNYVMAIVGASKLSGVFWSVIIEEYSHFLRLKRVQFPSIEALADHFLMYLKDNATLFNFSIYDQRFMEVHLNEGLDFVEAQLVKEKRGPLEYQIINVLTKHLKDLQKNYNNSSFISINVKQLTKTYFQLAKKSLLKRFKGLNNLNDDLLDKITNTLIGTMLFSIQKGWNAKSLESALYAMGYGEEEIYPTVLKLETFGFFQNQVMISDREIYKVSETPLLSLPLAQHDIFDMFFNGLGQHHAHAILNLQDQQFKSMLNEATKIGITQEQSIKLIEIYKNKRKVFQTGLVAIRNYEKTKLNSIIVAPVEDLYDLTLGIVKATIIKRRYETSQSHRTVGGKVHSILLKKRQKPTMKVD